MNPTRSDKYFLPNEELHIMHFRDELRKINWQSGEITIDEDVQRYPTLTEGMKNTIINVLSFFAIGDGLVCSLVMHLLEEINKSEVISNDIKKYFLAFLSEQNTNEVEHARTYTKLLTILPIKERTEAVHAVDSDGCVKAKAEFVEKYILKNSSLGIKFLAAAFTEGVFFASLFAYIFLFRLETPIRMDAIVRANLFIAQDESIHRDADCWAAKFFGGVSQEEAYNIAKEAVMIEEMHIDLMIKNVFFGVEEDVKICLTRENLVKYTKSLANICLIKSGFEALYEETDASTPHWMRDISLGVRENFYEVTRTQYKTPIMGSDSDI